MIATVYLVRSVVWYVHHVTTQAVQYRANGDKDICDSRLTTTAKSENLCAVDIGRRSVSLLIASIAPYIALIL